MFTPELNASEQKRMAGSYNGHNDAGGGLKKPKLSPAPSTAGRTLRDITAPALKMLMFLAVVSTIVPASAEVTVEREVDASPWRRGPWRCA